MKTTGNILVAFLAGAGIGAVIGILMAPDKGSVTREKLISRTKDLAENLKNKIEELREGEPDLEHKNRQEFYDEAFSEGAYQGS